MTPPLERFLFPEMNETTSAEVPAVESPRRNQQPADATDGTPWRQGWDLTDEEREVFRNRSAKSRTRKAVALSGAGPKPLHPINKPRLDPAELMPKRAATGFRALSLFSGGGGLDLSFDLAGFDHVASHDILSIAGETLRHNRPSWAVFAGEDEGDVCPRTWKQYRGQVDVVHGGPPCQPFSMAGRQLGKDDTRDMFPEFIRAVQEIRPRAFVAENVAALGQPKFQSYLLETVYQPLTGIYKICRFELKAEWFGVPQLRTRLFFVGFREPDAFARFIRPEATHEFCRHLEVEGEARGATPLIATGSDGLLRTMGAREALGLPNSGYDDLAPTIRSGFTGPRKTTSVNSSVSALRAWGRLGIWPNGVASNRQAAHLFVTENGHFRLSVQDCAVLQGFPETWHFCGAVYSVLGQIGNSVAPPMGYRVALAVAEALGA